MFCMGCGAELPARGDSCAVCGRALDGAAKQLRQASPLILASAPASPAAAAPPSASAFPAPSIAHGDLATTGLPRDPAGRALLILVLALLADLLVPWADQVGSRWSPAQSGLTTLLIVVVLAAALIPLASPALRANPLAAVAPLVVGGVGLGASVVLWIALRSGALAATALFSSAPPDSRLILESALLPPATPDFGLYLFALGAAVLILVGYQVFLDAARASAPAQQRPVAVSAPQASQYEATLPALRAEWMPPPAPAASGPAPALVEQPSPELVPAAISRPLLPLAPSSLTLAPANGGSAPEPLAQPPTRPLALPGTAEWTTAPSPPEPQRPGGRAGWRRQAGAR